MAQKHIHASYHLGLVKPEADKIAETVLDLLGRRYPSFTITFSQDCFTASGQPLHTLRVAADRLPQPVILEVLTFVAGIVDTTKYFLARKEVG